MVDGYRVTRLLPLEVGLVPGSQFFVKGWKTSWFRRFQGIFMAKIQIVTKPFVVVRVLRRSILQRQQSFVEAGQIGENCQHVRISRRFLSSDY